MKNAYWTKRADQEFQALDPQTQKDWADLRHRVNRQVFNKLKR